MPPVYYHEGKFPPDERLDWSKLIPLIGRANAAVARYDGVLGATPNPDVLLAPLRPPAKRRFPHASKAPRPRWERYWSRRPGGYPTRPPAGKTSARF